MKKHPRWKAALPALVTALLATALLFAAPRSAFAQTQTEEWVDTGRFGAEEPEEEPAAPQAAEKGLDTDWFYLGLRTGPSLRFYTPSDDTLYTGNDTLSVSMDIALQANVHLLSFLSLQTEMVFTWDNASLWAYTGTIAANDRYTRDYTAFSFQFPFIAKFDFYPGSFRLSPFAGIYGLVPLGKLEASVSLNDDKESLSYKISPSMGFLGGLGGGMKFGPGMIIADLRYAADLGDFEAGGTKIFRRSMISLTVGYELGFFTKKKGGKP
ncbi:MAG: hypothetical protein LBG22_02055 [Treponema sp.]|jgi:hypothetical protein|nr:hypothetical protein [Treponema sp.]